MEEENEPTSGVAMVPLALSILAVVLGAAGFYFGLTANQLLSPITESMEAGSSSAARIEKALEATETKMVELGSQVDGLKKALDRVRGYGSQNERVVEQMATASENREEIVKIAEGLNKVAAVGTTHSAVSSSSTSSAESETLASPSPPAVASDGTYMIQAGDNFGKIAKKLGVGLQDLLDANPEKDPRRLMIGTMINVPTE